MITIKDVIRYQKRMIKVKKDGFKACDYKSLGRELQKEFNLDVREVTAILNNRSSEILAILKGGVR